MYKNKQHGMLSTAASLGLIHLWDVDGGLTPIDKYLYTSEDYIKAGALLALGLVNVGVRNDCDPAFALLSDYVLSESVILRVGAVLGLGLAYAGSQHADLTALLLPVMEDKKSTQEVVALAAISCGMINAASGNHEVVSTILQTLLELPHTELNEGTYSRFFPLALGLLYLGKKEAIESTSAALEVLPDPFKSFAKITLQMCAFAGSGDVLVIQQLLHICSESPLATKEETKKEGDKKGKEDKKEKEKKELLSKQAVATLAVAVIAIGEETGTEMALRIFGQLGRYGENPIRRVVPLAIALLSISNPQLSAIDVLNKYSHDLDEEVAVNAIFSMGLVGAGTNNARLATMLRQLAQYHTKNSTHLFMVRIAQGLTHLGKGTLSLSPFHTDRQVMNLVAISGLLVTLFY